MPRKLRLCGCVQHGGPMFRTERFGFAVQARVKKRGMLAALALLRKYTADDAIEGCKGAKPCLDDGKELLPVLV